MCIIIKEEVHECEQVETWEQLEQGKQGRNNLNSCTEFSKPFLKVCLGMNTFKFYLKTTKLKELHQLKVQHATFILLDDWQAKGLDSP